VENAVRLEPDGHVQIEDVSFRYLPDRPLIEGLSLDVRPGQRIAIVGPTGCGKTTLINLLMRFYDVNGGAIKVSGTDIRNVTRASLRGSYGMVLQDTWLRAGTVRENIAYGRPDATLDEVVAAAKAECELVVPDAEDITFLEAEKFTSRVDYGGYTAPLAFLGRHAAGNAAVAVELALALWRKGFEIPDEAILAGPAAVPTVRRKPGSLSFYSIR